MSHFREALAQARQLAQQLRKTNPKDNEALFMLALATGMECDAESILLKRHLEALKRMKQANECAKQLLAQPPDFSDAYVALGVANYISARWGLVPASRSGLVEYTVTKARHAAGRQDSGGTVFTSGLSRKSHPCRTP
jgi:tetratricopeptide (TPR) repeat protein